MKEKNIYAFIDSQNLNLGIKSQKWQLDFRKFRMYLRNKYKVTKAYIFIGYIPKNKQLYTSLTEAGYELIFKPVVESKKLIKPKGNIDAELVLHAMIEYPNYDKAIIVSGDGDFYCLVEYLQKKGKLLHILAPTRSYSSLLSKFATYIVLLSQLKNALALKKTGIRGRSKP